MEVRVDRGVALWNGVEQIWLKARNDRGLRRILWKEDLREARRLLLHYAIRSGRVPFTRKEAGWSNHAKRNSSRIHSSGWSLERERKHQDAFSTPYRSFDTLDEALGYATSNFNISKAFWIANSELLKQGKEQRKITDYVSL